MPCFHPLPAWRSRKVNGATGRRPVTFRLADGYTDMPVQLPCGRCVGCIQDRASEWALRCEHEAKMHRSNWFLTFTYDPEHLPADGSLKLDDLQRFWKRARLEWPGLRYFACGEYGEKLGRPHYHALVFNWLPSDLTRRERHNGEQVFSCPSVERVWGLGHVRVDAFSPAAAQYVANYVRKRVFVDSESHYRGKAPEFQVMSRRPGIGHSFVKRFISDIYPDGFVTRAGGSRRRAPRFYDSVLFKYHPRMLRKVKRARAAAAAASPDGRGSRPFIREQVERGRQAFFDSVKGRPFERNNT